MKNIYSIIIGLALVVVTACQKDKSESFPFEDEIRFSSSIIPLNDDGKTRASIGKDGKGYFEKGDQISLYVTPEQGTTSKYTMVYNGTFWTKEDGISYLTWSEIGTERATFTAYYPTIDTEAMLDYVHYTDENPMIHTPEEAEEPDLLGSSSEASKSEGVVHFRFQHAMSFLEVNIRSEYGYTMEEIDRFGVTIEADNGASIITSTGQIRSFEKNDARFIFEKIGTGKYTTILCPQSVKLRWKNTEMIKISTPDKDISIRAPAQFKGIPFTKIEQGKKYTFNITLNKEGDETVESGITWWCEGINKAAIPDEAQWGLAHKTSNPTIEDDILGLMWKREYGWYDCKKNDPDEAMGNKPYPDDDARLCWAAAASNGVHWWLDRNQKHLDRYGYRGPREYGDAFSSEIFHHYKWHFGNKGGLPVGGLRWFFVGNDYCGVAGEIVERRHTGFFRDLMLQNDNLSRLVVVGTGASFKDLMDKALIHDRHYYIGFSTSQANAHHAMSIWGGHYDERGNLTHVYYVDNNMKELEFQGVRKGEMVAGKLSPCGIMKAPVKEIDGVWHIRNANKNGWVHIGEIVLLYDCHDIWEDFFRINPNWDPSTQPQWTAPTI